MAQQGGGPAPNGALPLIFCSQCRRRRVVRRVSTTTTTGGQVFYCCPFHKKNSGCPFFYWEDEYEEHLKELARKGLLAGLLGGNDCEASTSTFNVRPEASGFLFDDTSQSGPAKVKKEAVYVPRGQEELNLLRAICVVCVGILLVQFLMLIVLLVK